MLGSSHVRAAARLGALALAVAAGVSLAGQPRSSRRPSPPAGEWWYYGGDSGSTKYPPLIKSTATR